MPTFYKIVTKATNEVSYVQGLSMMQTLLDIPVKLNIYLGNNPPTGKTHSSRKILDKLAKYEITKITKDQVPEDAEVLKNALGRPRKEAPQLAPVEKQKEEPIIYVKPDPKRKKRTKKRLFHS